MAATKWAEVVNDAGDKIMCTARSTAFQAEGTKTWFVVLKTQEHGFQVAWSHILCKDVIFESPISRLS